MSRRECYDDSLVRHRSPQTAEELYRSGTGHSVKSETFPAICGFSKRCESWRPTEFNAWLNLDKIVGREDGTIPRKFRELIALGVAFMTQCPYCIEVHVKAAKVAGASREEITEGSLIAAALWAGGAATHGAIALKFYDKP